MLSCMCQGFYLNLHRLLRQISFTTPPTCKQKVLDRAFTSCFRHIFFDVFATLNSNPILPSSCIIEVLYGCGRRQGTPSVSL